MKLGIAQIEACNTPEESLHKARDTVEQAARKGVDLLFFPEMFMAAPEKREEILRMAEPLDGEYVRELCQLAKGDNITLGAGVWEEVSGEDRVYNTFVLINSEGAIQSVYRKLHLFDALNVRESEFMIPGSEPPPIVQVQDFSLGPAICYDLRFPELFRHLALQGAQLILVPAAWYSGPLKEEQWLTLLQARAIENTVFVAGSGLVGSRFCTRSCVVDPFGVICLDAGEEEGLSTLDLSIQRLSRVRKKLPSLQHIRSDVFY